MFDGLVAFAVDRWCHDSGARRVRFRSRPGSPMKEGRLILGTFSSELMRVLYRSRQNDRLRVMLVLVHIGITPPHIFSQPFKSCKVPFKALSERLWISLCIHFRLIMTELL
ncbi:hypothetical protein TNCV_1159161 [Trichonephila clavipes]|nr:hypothetical protein TNCV_1159161 [Trichonephila clavipes]